MLLIHTSKLGFPGQPKGCVLDSRFPITCVEELINDILNEAGVGLAPKGLFECSTYCTVSACHSSQKVERLESQKAVYLA